MADGLCPRCRAPLEGHEVAKGIVARACPTCFGVLYRAQDIAVPLGLAPGPAGNRPCPSCGAAMLVSKGFSGALELDQCEPCGLLWFDAGEIQVLRKLTGIEQIVGRREKKPAKPAAGAGPAAAVIAAAGLAAPAPVPGAGGITAALRQQAPKTTDDDAADLMPPDMSGAENPDADWAPLAVHDGISYQHFQTADAVTIRVLGEFPWIAAVGDVARVRDFIAPPFLLSEEVSGTESVWSRGEWLPPEEVWAAFSQPGSPPRPSGAAPAQPNPWAEDLPKVMASGWLAAGVCLGAFVLAVALGSNGAKALEEELTFQALEAEKSKVTSTFRLDGRTANAKVHIETNLDNRWAVFNMALINAETDVAFDFGKEISVYSGIDDGEHWSEGSNRGSVIVPSVPAGDYYLRVEPETDATPLVARFRVTRDEPLLRLPLVAWLLLFLPLLWVYFRSNAFENQRWMESDHPRVSEDDDSDWSDDE